MSRLRALIGIALATALAVGTLAAPASAQIPDAELVIGHGIPGAVVDVCVKDLTNGGGQLEVASNFRYGKWFKASLPPSLYRFIVRAAKGGNCNGAKIITADVPLKGGENLSVIATITQGVPIYQVFDNNPPLNGVAPAPNGTYLSVKHAAMIGKADVWISPVIRVRSVPTPTLSGVPKGAQATLPFPPSDVKVAVGKTGQGPLRETPFWEVKAGKVNHVVAVGTKKNLRFLRYRTTPSLMVTD